MEELKIKPNILAAIIPRIIFFTMMLTIILSPFYIIIVILPTFVDLTIISFSFTNYTNFIITFHTIVVIFLTILSIMNLKTTSFTFYKNQLEYSEGFLTKKKKTIPYKRITNIFQTESVSERIFGVGTIHVDTAGRSIPELSMRYIDHPSKVHEEIKKRIKL